MIPWVYFNDSMGLSFIPWVYAIDTLYLCHSRIPWVYLIGSMGLCHWFHGFVVDFMD